MQNILIGKHTNKTRVINKNFIMSKQYFVVSEAA